MFSQKIYFFMNFQLGVPVITGPGMSGSMTTTKSASSWTVWNTGASADTSHLS